MRKVVYKYKARTVKRDRGHPDIAVCFICGKVIGKYGLACKRHKRLAFEFGDLFIFKGSTTKFADIKTLRTKKG